MNNKAFTLIELLVVIAILAVLAVAVTLILNPAELIRQGRDSIRLSDLATINKALGLYQTDQIAKWMGTSTIVYTSLPDLDSSCSSYGLPSLPSGWTYNCETTTTYTNVNGTGWLPVDFTNMSFSSPLARLPVDPVNQATTSKYYTYVTGGSWELSAVMEAVSNKLGGDNDRVSEDGGDSYSYYELGSDVNLSPINDDGLVGYWSLDEGSGATTADSSGNGNDGTITGASWSTNCIYGNCLSFDGDVDYVQVPNITFLDSDSWSFSHWIRWAGQDSQFVFYTGSLSSNRSFLLRCNSNRFAFRDKNNSYHLFAIDSSTPYIGEWTHLVWIANGNGDLSLYINGELFGASIDVPTELIFQSIGRGYSGYYFAGLIDDVRIYNRALSASEIQAMYNSY